jgi:hypothetical protein
VSAAAPGSAKAAHDTARAMLARAVLSQHLVGNFWRRGAKRLGLPQADGGHRQLGPALLSVARLGAQGRGFIEQAVEPLLDKPVPAICTPSAATHAGSRPPPRYSGPSKRHTREVPSLDCRDVAVIFQGLARIPSPANYFSPSWRYLQLTCCVCATLAALEHCPPASHRSTSTGVQESP